MWIRIVQRDACVTRFVISLTTERSGEGGIEGVLETMNRRKNTMFMIYEFRVQRERREEGIVVCAPRAIVRPTKDEIFPRRIQFLLNAIHNGPVKAAIT